MNPGHRDDQPVLVPRQVPRRGQVHGERVVRVTVHSGPPRSAGAGHRGHRPVGEAYPAQQVVDRVGDHQVVPGHLGHVRRQQAQALRLGELGRVRRPVGPAAPPRAEPPQDRRAVRRQLHDLVRRRRRHQKTPARRGDRLAREVQRPVKNRRGYVRSLPPPQRPLGLVYRDQLVDQRGEPGSVSLAGHRRDDVPLRVDHAQGRPGPGGVLAPRHHLRIVQHRMRHAVPLDGRRERVGILLVLELRRVHPDRHQYVAVPLLQRPQLVQHVQAVDAAERPEVQQHDLAAQLGQAQPAPAGVHLRAQLLPRDQQRRHGRRDLAGPAGGASQRTAGPCPGTCPRCRPWT